MAKSKDKDAQVLLHMLDCQLSMHDIMDSNDCDDVETCLEKKVVVDLLTFYTLKLVGISKNLTKKTLSEDVDFFDEDLNKLVSDSIGSVYPIISASEVVSYAVDLCSAASRGLVKDLYDKRIGTSQNK